MKSIFDKDNTFKNVRLKIIKNCAERMMVQKYGQCKQQEELTAEEKELCGII